MAVFEVELYEVCVQTYVVEAETPEAAVVQGLSTRGMSPIDTDIICLDEDRSDLHPDTHNELCEAVRLLGVDLDDEGCVPGVRAVRRRE